jgi:hypothetical protein
MRNLKRILPLVLAFCGAIPAAAQTTDAKDNAAGKGGMAPVFTTLLAGSSGKTLSATAMKALLDSALVAKDSTGQLHQVVSFDFGYRTTDVFPNDTTGRPETSRLYTSFHFKGNRLDSLWRTEIGSQIKPGDELFFDRVVAADKGVNYLCSPVHFSVK